MAQTQVEHKGKTFAVDEDEFLQNPEEWCEEWVDYVRNKEGIQEITDEHGIAPMVRVLAKVTGFKLKYIYELFPSGPGKGACKMAGLPKPTGCV